MNSLSNSQNPVVSVITVTYNAVHSLRKTIQSVIAQDYDNLEYLIVDGMSNDGTVDIIKSEMHHFSKVLIEPDEGIFDAMNKGVSIATGDWVIFMNAGDAFYNEHVISSIFYAKDYSSYDVIYGDVLAIYRFGMYVVSPSNLNRITNQMPFCHQSSFTRRTALLDYKFDLCYNLSADHDFFLRIYKQSPSLFYYQPIIVSVFDGVDGASSVNSSQVVSEISHFSPLSRVMKLRLAMKSFLPLKFVDCLSKVFYLFNKRYKRIKSVNGNII